jgi:hypothetical protein
MSRHWNVSTAGTRPRRRFEPLTLCCACCIRIGAAVGAFRSGYPSRHVQLSGFRQLLLVGASFGAVATNLALTVRSLTQTSAQV